MNPFSAATRAVNQLDDKVMLGTMLRSTALSAALFLLIAAGVTLGVQAMLAGNGWWAWAAGALGGISVLVLSAWLFLPVACLIAFWFSDRVAWAVERRYYPQLPPAVPASFASLTWDGLTLGLRVLLLQVAAMAMALIVPGIGIGLGWAIAAWALGRGMFVVVAMRRMDRTAAIRLYRRRRLAVLTVGALLIAANLLPLVNLLVPVLAVAAMVHLQFQQAPAREAIRYGL